MLIKKATIRDAGRLKEMLLLLNQEPQIDQNLKLFLKDADSWERWFYRFFDLTTLINNSGSCFLAEDNEGAAIGICYIVVPKWRLRVGKLGIAVHRDYRRKGVGSALLKKAVKWAIQPKLRVLVADVWAQNEVSLKFFSANGFKEETRWMEQVGTQSQEKVRLTRFPPPQT